MIARRNAGKLCWLVGAGVAALAQQPARAQETSQAPETPVATNDDALDADAIIVTGSRIPRAGFDTLQPAIVVGDEQIEQRAATNVADVLNEQPAFGTPGASPLSIQTQAGGGGAAVSAGQNFA